MELYYTGKPCKRGHICQRIVRNRTCIECYRLLVAKGQRKWLADNPEKRKENRRQYYSRHPEARRRAAGTRRAAELNRTPKWMDRTQINKIYNEAERLTKETGIQYDVDHYYPLRGITVSGLHVHENLQIITRAENLKKSNSFPER